jgi:DNA-binding CsgD family transcriptional regulator
MDAAYWMREYEHVLASRKIREEDCDPAVLDYHIPFLERLDAIEGSSIALFDFRTRNYRFLTHSFKFLAGYDRDAAITGGPDFFFRIMKRDHLPFVLETVTRSFAFLDGAPPAERKDYRLSFDFAIEPPGRKAVRLVQQVVVLELDRRGNIWLVLIANDLAPSGAADAAPARRFLNTRTGVSQLFSDGTKDSVETDLSRRELEVLGLVASGMASREIADRLFISVNTVNNHRQRILEKLDSRSSAEAVRYAMSLGLI